MLRVLLSAVLTIPLVANAAVYQCSKGGVVSFQDQPCVRGSRTLKVFAANEVTVPMLLYGLKPDMNIDEVRRRIPGTVEGDGEEVERGVTRKLRLNKVMYQGKAYWAGLYFNEDRFVRVTVTSSDAMLNDDTLVLYNREHAARVRQYGAPQRATLNGNEQSLPPSAEWFSKEGKAWVRIVPVTPQTSYLEFGLVPIN